MQNFQHQQAPSQEPLDALLRRIEPKLKRIIGRYGIPAQDAEDLVQQALLAFVHKRDGIRDTETWLVGSVKKECLMYARKRQRRLYDAVDSAVLEMMTDDSTPSQERAAVVHDLTKCVAKIPTRCRSLLKMRYRLGYEASEVAQKLGYRSSSIRKITSRCLAALTKQMLSGGYSNGEAAIE